MDNIALALVLIFCTSLGLIGMMCAGLAIAEIVSAKLHVMTREELDAQRKSWVIGEMMLEHPEMTREEAEAIWEKVGGA